MLKIAICDDEKVFRDNINKYVAAYLNEKEISYEIDTFSSGKEIIDLGIEILPMKVLANEMSSGVPYYEGELYNVIRQGRNTPAVPLVIIGISQ